MKTDLRIAKSLLGMLLVSICLVAPSLQVESEILCSDATKSGFTKLNCDQCEKLKVIQNGEEYEIRCIECKKGYMNFDSFGELEGNAGEVLGKEHDFDAACFKTWLFIFLICLGSVIVLALIIIIILVIVKKKPANRQRDAYEDNQNNDVENREPIEMEYPGNHFQPARLHNNNA